MSVLRRSKTRDILRRLLLLDEPPSRTALAFGIGVFFAFSPLWGLHTVLGLVAAFLFRLNRLAVLVGVWVNNPWTMAPTASVGTALGFWLLGTEVSFPSLTEASVISAEFWGQMLLDFEHLFWPFLLGNFVLAGVAGVTAYFVLLRVLRRNALRKSVVSPLVEIED
jgi:uncharacterized protein (DUF2062 family)